jgi:hypothetical protein
LIPIIYAVSASWLGLLNFAFFAAVGCRVIDTVAWVIGKPLPPFDIAAALFASAFLATAWGLINAAWLRITHTTIALPHLPEADRLLALNHQRHKEEGKGGCDEKSAKKAKRTKTKTAGPKAGRGSIRTRTCNCKYSRALPKDHNFQTRSLVAAVKRGCKLYRSFAIKVSEENKDSCNMVVSAVLNADFEWRDAWEESWSLARTHRRARN